MKIPDMKFPALACFSAGQLQEGHLIGADTKEEQHSGIPAVDWKKRKKGGCKKKDQFILVPYRWEANETGFVQRIPVQFRDPGLVNPDLQNYLPHRFALKSECQKA
eukprot:scaffold298438_cov89-Attheya_sp.AAC.1